MFPYINDVKRFIQSYRRIDKFLINSHWIKKVTFFIEVSTILKGLLLEHTDKVAWKLWSSQKIFLNFFLKAGHMVWSSSIMPIVFFSMVVILYGLKYLKWPDFFFLIVSASRDLNTTAKILLLNMEILVSFERFILVNFYQRTLGSTLTSVI